MTDFPLDELYRCIDQTLGLVDFEYQPEMPLDEIPGWDSLHQTMLLMEIEGKTGIDLSSDEVLESSDIKALHRAVLEKLHPSDAPARA